MIRKIIRKLFKRKVKTFVTGRDTRRSFTKTQRVFIWEKQKGRCNKCKKKLDLRTAIYDHKRRWADSGKTDIKNGQALCPNCNNMKNFNENVKLADTRLKNLLVEIK